VTRRGQPPSAVRRAKLGLAWHFGGGANAPPLHHTRDLLFRVQERGIELRFEVNGQMFFVNFVPEEGRW